MLKMTAEELLEYATEHGGHCPDHLSCQNCPLECRECASIVSACEELIGCKIHTHSVGDNRCSHPACDDCAVAYRCLAEGEPLQFTPKQDLRSRSCGSTTDCSKCEYSWKCLMEGSHPKMDKKAEQVDHPQHYGGKDNPYEAIKVIEANGWLENFCLANCYKYVARAGKKGDKLEDLKKAAWYLNHLIKTLEETK